MERYLEARTNRKGDGTVADMILGLLVAAGLLIYMGYSLIKAEDL
jgi:K+-transporting ATPase KdpF subunit